jgi:hypothetical protein
MDAQANLDSNRTGDAPDREAGPSDALGNADVVAPVAEDLLLWLLADKGVTESQGTVTLWADQSGHHLDARQSDPTRQPKLVSIGSSRQVVTFDDDDFMSLPSGFDDFTRGISMFVVFDTQSTLNCVDALDFSNGPEIDDITIGRHDGKVHYEVLDGALPGDNFPLGARSLASVVQTADHAVALRINSGPLATTSFEEPVTIVRISNVVGRSLYADCGSLNGSVAEALVYNRALDNSERVSVEAYLQARWDCCR